MREVVGWVVLAVVGLAWWERWGPHVVRLADRWLDLQTKRSAPPPPPAPLVPLPPDLDRLAREESATWAQEQTRDWMRELYAQHSDWDKVRQLVAQHRMVEREEGV